MIAHRHTLAFATRVAITCAGLALLGGATAPAALAQTSFVSVSQSDMGLGCTQPNNPWNTAYGYANFTIRHKIACSSGEVTLDTQYLNATYSGSCGSWDPVYPTCTASAASHVQDNGSIWSVTVVASNSYRTYYGSEFSCESAGQVGWGNVSFTKVTAAEVCP